MKRLLSTALTGSLIGFLLQFTGFFGEVHKGNFDLKFALIGACVSVGALIVFGAVNKVKYFAQKIGESLTSLVKIVAAVLVAACILFLFYGLLK